MHSFHIEAKSAPRWRSRPQPESPPFSSPGLRRSFPPVVDEGGQTRSLPGSSASVPAFDFSGVSVYPPARAVYQERAASERADAQSEERGEKPAHEPLQAKFATSETLTRLRSRTGEVENRTGMPDNLKAGLEQLSGIDLSGVRVHKNSSRPAQLNALAYTQGHDIYIGPSQERHLPHEGWHAVQQLQGRVNPTLHSRGVPVNDDADLEREADAMGARAAARPNPASLPSISAGFRDRATVTLTTPTQAREDSDKPVFEEYKGTPVNKIGHVSAPAGQYAIARTSGVNVRAKPDGTLRHIAKVVYDTEVQVQALDNTGAFYFIVARTGVVGWINKNFVALDPPDIGSRLHHITESNLTTILKNEYIDKKLWMLATGNDYTTLAAAVVVANEGRKGVSVDWAKAKKYKDDHTLKRLFDPWMIDNFAIYHGSTVLAGHNIWLPSPTYVRMLQKSGVIGSRPGWINTAVDIGKGIAGFFAGVVSGVFGSLWDTLTGLWELGEGIVSAVRGILDGSLFASIRSIYDTITGMSWEDLKKMVDDIITMGKNAFDDFQNKWEHPDTYKQWHFKGYIVGAIALEVVLAVFTGGATLGAKVLAKIGKYFPKLMRVLNKLLALEDKLPGRRGKRGKAKDRDKDDKDMSSEDRAWEQARAMAAMITETHDEKDTPVDVLIPMLNSTIAARFKGVSRYKAIPTGAPGTYKIIQMARRNVVDEHYTGMLRGVEVELPGVSTTRIKYTKRPRSEYQRLRSQFDSTVREKFLKDHLAGDPKKLKQLRKAGLTDADIKLLQDGYVPPGWQVHHKLPLDDGGTNDFDNLILMKNEPYHKTITNSHNKAIAGMSVGETRTMDYPIPKGFVYPP